MNFPLWGHADLCQKLYFAQDKSMNCDSAPFPMPIHVGRALGPIRSFAVSVLALSRARSQPTQKQPRLPWPNLSSLWSMCQSLLNVRSVFAVFTFFFSPDCLFYARFIATTEVWACRYFLLDLGMCSQEPGNQNNMDMGVQSIRTTKYRGELPLSCYMDCCGVGFGRFCCSFFSFLICWFIGFWCLFGVFVFFLFFLFSYIPLNQI